MALFWRRLNDVAAFAQGYAAAAAGSPPATAEAASAGVVAFLRVVAASAYRALAGLAYVTRRAFAESPDWVGWWTFVVGVGGVICALTAGLFWSTVFSVSAGDTYLETLRRRAESERGVASGVGDGDARGNLREGEGGRRGASGTVVRRSGGKGGAGRGGLRRLGVLRLVQKRRGTRAVVKDWNGTPQTGVRRGTPGDVGDAASDAAARSERRRDEARII